MVSEMLEEIKRTIMQRLPERVQVAKVEFEGPEVVIYTKNPEIITENGNLIRDIAKDIRKRIIIRSDRSVLMDPEKAIRKIHEIVPEEAKITNISFDDVTCEVIIEARKPGLVIGKYGSTSREIVKNTGWAPKILRTPPISSEIIERIRRTLRKNSKERKKILQQLGNRIHQKPKYDNDWARLTAMGGFREVGRSCLYLQTPNSRVLLDCGVNVAGGDDKNSYPYLNVPEFTLDSLDAVIITHAHLDHSGFLPYLYHYGYDGPVYCTAPTRDLMTLLQLDHIDIAHREDEPLPFNVKHVKKSVKHTITLDYGEVTDIAPDIRLTLHNAGHILGSAMAHLHIGDGQHNMVYTGDFKYEQSRLLEAAANRFPRIETLVMESTYGGHEDVQPSRNRAEKELVKTIYSTLRRGGKILIPVFAVGRAQELMIVLEEYIRTGIIDEVPVYIDGMIWEANAIHTARPEYLSKDLRDQIFHMGHNPFISDIFHKVNGMDERREIVEGEPSIILSTSGMLTGGNSLEYFKWLCEDPDNSLVFVGYQAEGSLGRRIQKGWKEIPLKDEDDKMRVYNVRMNIKTIEGFSGHSDRRQLMEYVKRISPKPEKILLCHGDNYKTLDLASSIYRTYRIETKTPLNLETVRIQ
ncbi:MULTISPECIES: beta-CASP ribonuclease aCPSF1 [Methanothermobacter]|jgi:KH/beta-lactamase-domain protein|uniref:Transcription termination factor FttA n=3 Tax=Methanothermobacter TaxID=145260 RepID=FTTA_METTH|nr:MULTISPECIES: beta-CASP ribonuclease aCPSF1 [Methanothermobacter]2YCB_A Chain A, CLEAVAGE AND POLYADENYLATION SPECIFICITY FACTOR [Methanothermobacter thermautotrophicus str. Delta H]2YCB_B Chain B, CLEAVAGE AND POLYADENYLATION SPECIFICITY FACTOR [Methanothermobacter thermautotrophicus str. Delta H]MBC7111494.1 beta-CASP ribonuclease aCPSF1 [Methanothermobacter sp.]AAB85692.1 cleavage and polyadenylation specificity factor [Methanothermobacter thermautotrophicus str. Delta H]MDI6818861.1 bet